MGADRHAVIVVHVGGAYGDALAARERFVAAFEGLSPLAARNRLALENDDRIFSLQDTLWIHRRTGMRLVLDVLHHRCLTARCFPGRRAGLSPWPPGRRIRSPRSTTAARVRNCARLHRNGDWRVQMPLPNQHSDFINPFEFIDLLRTAREETLRPFDIMLEAKAKDLALLRLRQLVERYAPDLASVLA